MAKNHDPAKAEPTFESAIERLEAIVDQMESDKMPLEELLVRYEEGVKLVKLCSEKLESAEKRIEIIARTAGGKPRVTEFEPSEASGGEPSDSATAAVVIKKQTNEDVRLF